MRFSSYFALLEHLTDYLGDSILGDYNFSKAPIYEDVRKLVEHLETLALDLPVSGDREIPE